MILSDELISQCIIIAGKPFGFSAKYKQILRKKGFENVQVVESSNKVYEIVRSMADFPDQMGVVVLHQDLPEEHIDNICKTFSGNGQGMDIPIIVAGEHGSAWRVKHGINNDSLVYNLSESCSETELLAMVELLLTIKKERSLRLKQEEQLINELAELKILGAKMGYLSEHDELTGLLTRSSLDSKLLTILHRNNNINRNGCLIYLDLNRFGLVNELEGFEEGDRLIVDLIGLIRKTIRADYLFSRLGYDEFCVYIDDISPSAAKKIAERIRVAIIEFRFISGISCYDLTVTIGLAMVITEKAISHTEELISRARQACQIAKEMGRNQAREYDENDFRIQQKNDDIQWVPLIRSALLEDRFFLEYQPVIDLKSSKISHYEVLIRLMSSFGEVINPDEFIPVAERVGMIHSIDLWVVENAIQFLAGLPLQMDQISLAINLSSQAIQDELLLPAIKQLLELNKVNPGRITFEITETAVIENFDKARQMILNIRALGCRFALDDFGTGFCSFNYLKSFPIDYIKIDGQFLKNIANDETDRILVKAMCDIAKKLELKTIAEYIETLEVLNMAKKLGVDFGQGHLFGLPTPNILENNVLKFAGMTLSDSPILRTIQK
jgi:diguanylate cyclase (GGDEF)-like protein